MAFGEMDTMQPETLPGAWASWQLQELLGTGSYGTVWCAQKEWECSAIKIIRIPQDEAERAALLAEAGGMENAEKYLEDLAENCAREIRAMYTLRDERHIVRIEDYIMEKLPGPAVRICIRMELLTPLRAHFRERTVSEKDAARIGADLCSALEACRKRNILHRDIKPDNIFWSEDGIYKLGDFGTARRLDLTFSTHSVKGTYSFMAPEVYRGDACDSRADLYSLGLVLYRFMNRGRDPFTDPSKKLIYYQDREDALRRRMDGEPLPKPIDASQEFFHIIERACSFRPDDRYPDAQAMQKDILGLLQKKGEQKPAVSAHIPSAERKLTGLAGAYLGAEIPMRAEESLVFGRDIAKCSIVLEGEDISRVHCTVRVDRSGLLYYVTDHSRNGTFLEGSGRLIRETSYPCRPGSVLSLGSGKIRFLLG